MAIWICQREAVKCVCREMHVYREGLYPWPQEFTAGLGTSAPGAGRSLVIQDMNSRRNCAGSGELEGGI